MRNLQLGSGEGVEDSIGRGLMIKAERDNRRTERRLTNADYTPVDDESTCVP